MAVLAFRVFKKSVQSAHDTETQAQTGVFFSDRIKPNAQNIQKENLMIFIMALGFRIAVLLVMLLIVSFSVNENNGMPALREIFSRWDGRHYIHLVEDGYAGYIEDGKPLFLVFFPLYVWVTRALTWIIPHTIAAGLIVSFLSYAGGCVFIYRLVEKFYTQAAAQKTILYLSIFPFSFFFGGMMTEGIFLLTTAASLYYTAEHKWLKAGIWGMFASMSRMTGLLTAVAIAIEYIEVTKPLRRQYEKRWILQWLLKACCAGIPILGTLTYLLLNYHVTGNAFAFLEHQKHWHQGSEWLPNTIQLVVGNAFRHFGDEFAAGIWIPDSILFFVFLILLLLAFRKKDGHQNFLLGYGFAYLTLTYSLSWLLSGGRYLSASIVFFIFAAVIAEKHKWLDKVIVVSSSMLFGVYLYAFLLGKQVM